MRNPAPYLLAVMLAAIVFLIQEQRINNLQKQLPDPQESTQARSPLPLSRQSATTLKSQTSGILTDTSRARARVIKNRLTSVDGTPEKPSQAALIQQGTLISIPGLYGEFIESLELTEKEAAYFQTLLADRLSSQRELGKRWEQSGTDRKPELTREIAIRQMESQNEIRQFLNHPGDLTDFLKYEQQLPDRQVLRSIRESLSLSDEVENRLLETLSLHRQQMIRKNGGDPDSWTSLFTQNKTPDLKIQTKLTEQISDLLGPKKSELFFNQQKQQ